MIEINHNFVEKTLADYQVLQAELRAHREYLQMLFDIFPAEMMTVYDIFPLEDKGSAFQAILSNDRQYQVTSYLLRTTKGFMDSLPAEERALIEARYIKSQTWVDVARLLNISASTAKNRRRVKILDMGVEFFLSNPCPPLPEIKRGLMEVIQHAPRL
ncbi:sigma factor-like helix-turn-helix DNA-binding protein [Cloacibacillus evryensis]|uniref:sigma factor-like helix-turn-helix DNA-binding protein n=1 Tax=Cloacibacillus evryensis TaxID=508460 RepID=UPI0022E81FB1|nr:sigma factor-like helix-turn-helix DNA-binding protein [Cloacibacillus evryensis]